MKPEALCLPSSVCCRAWCTDTAAVASNTEDTGHGRVHRNASCRSALRRPPGEEVGKLEGKKRFADAALALSKAFSLCCTLDEAKALRDEVAFMQAVKGILTKRDISTQKKTDEQREVAIRQIISQAVV